MCQKNFPKVIRQRTEILAHAVTKSSSDLVRVPCVAIFVVLLCFVILPLGCYEGNVTCIREIFFFSSVKELNFIVRALVCLPLVLSFVTSSQLQLNLYVSRKKKTELVWYIGRFDNNVYWRYLFSAQVALGTTPDSVKNVPWRQYVSVFYFSIFPRFVVEKAGLYAGPAYMRENVTSLYLAPHDLHTQLYA